MRYYRSGNVLWIFGQLWALILPLVFLIKGFTGKLSSYGEKWGKNWFFSIVVYLILFIPLYAALSFPFDFYADYLREHEYGLSNQTLGRWFANYGKSILVTFICSIATVWI
ncbi:MAG: hypothetical protein V4487_06715, partial [Chlamydiota bacterium]